MAVYHTESLFCTQNSLAAPYLFSFSYPWQALEGLGDAILELGAQLSEALFYQTATDVWIAKDAHIAPSASISGPCIIDRGAEIRHCAFIRGNALVGKGSVVGNSTELKNVLLFDGVQVPHYNYVGDSILGYKAHMGAGSITSNVKSDKSLVVIKTDDGNLETGRKKVGAILGDYVEVGCNSVLNPGSVLAPHCMVYPTSCVRGIVPPWHIWKNTGELVKMQSGSDVSPSKNK